MAELGNSGIELPAETDGEGAAGGLAGLPTATGVADRADSEPLTICTTFKCTCALVRPWKRPKLSCGRPAGHEVCELAGEGRG
jgi:hypothetical protein